MSITKRAWIAALVVLLLALAAREIYVRPVDHPARRSSAGPAPDIVSQLPAGAPVIAYVDVAALRGLRDSPLAAILGLRNARAKGDRDYAAFVDDTGFDYTRDLDKAAIALWPAVAGGLANGTGEQQVFVIADGRFDDQKIKRYAFRTGRAVSRGTRSLYQVPGHPPISFEFLSTTRIALASGTDAQEFVALSKPGARDPAIEARIDRLAGAPIFAVARTDNLPRNFYANFAKAPQLERLARSVGALTLTGRPAGERIKLQLDGECDSIKNALEIQTLLEFSRMGASMAIGDPKTRRQMTEEQVAFLGGVIKQLKIDHEDRSVRLTLDLTPEMLGRGHLVRSKSMPNAAP
jgi:hypothetical protein